MRLRPLIVVALIVALGIAIAFLLGSLLTDDGPPRVQVVDEGKWSSGSGPYYDVTDTTSLVLRVGGGAAVVPVRVTNGAPSNRTVLLSLVHQDTETTVIERRESLRPNETIRINLRHEGRYTVRTRDADTDASGEVTVTSDQFDCNDHLATLRFTANDTVESDGISTTMSCV